MKPLLFAFDLPWLGRVTFPAYFTLLAVGFGFAILLSWRDARKLDIDPDRIIDLNLYMILFGLIGARVLHLIADGHFMDYVNICLAPETVPAVGNVPATCTTNAQCGDYFLCNVAAGHCHPPRDCLLALKVWRGGLAYYGGFIFAVLFGLYYIRKHRLPMWRVTDLAGYGIPMGLFWGRMGCYLNGCCFGKITESSVGVVFPRGGAAWRHQRDHHLLPHVGAAALPVHPTQLYSSLINLAIFFMLYFGVRPRKRFDGQVFWWFAILYAIGRAVTEVFRDDDRGVVLGLISTSQIISLVILPLAVVMLRRLRRAAHQVTLPAPAAAVAAADGGSGDGAPEPPPRSSAEEAERSSDPDAPAS